jgi:hypothetical protein
VKLKLPSAEAGASASTTIWALAVVVHTTDAAAMNIPSIDFLMIVG